MASNNPLVAQGTLNRLRASVTWNDFPALNVTAPYLGEEGLSLTLEGDTTTYIKTMTGQVTSPEPYQPISLTMELLKTQSLGPAYKAQAEALALIGNGTVRVDASTFPAYDIVNCAIMGVETLKLNGKDAGYRVRIGGYYLVNQNLYNT